MASKTLDDEGMAKVIGCDRSYVHKLRNGKIPSPSMIAQIRERTNGAIQPNDWFDAQADEAA